LLVDPWRDDPEVSSGDEVDPYDGNVSFDFHFCVVRFVALEYIFIFLYAQYHQSILQGLLQFSTPLREKEPDPDPYLRVMVPDPGNQNLFLFDESVLRIRIFIHPGS
jgi:hypothetical protein